MSDRPTFGQGIVLVASGASLALFGCLGAIAADTNFTLESLGKIGFVAGLILVFLGNALLMVSLWRLYHPVPGGGDSPQRR